MLQAAHMFITGSQPVALQFILGFVSRMYTYPSVQAVFTCLNRSDSNHKYGSSLKESHGPFSNRKMVSRHSLKAQMPVRSVHIQERNRGTMGRSTSVAELGDRWEGADDISRAKGRFSSSHTLGKTNARGSDGYPVHIKCSARGELGGVEHSRGSRMHWRRVKPQM